MTVTTAQVEHLQSHNRRQQRSNSRLLQHPVGPSVEIPQALVRLEEPLIVIDVLAGHASDSAQPNPVLPPNLVIAFESLLLGGPSARPLSSTIRSATASNIPSILAPWLQADSEPDRVPLI